MSTTSVVVGSSTINGDTSANPNTLVQRDASGNINGAAIAGTSLSTSGGFTGAGSPQTASFSIAAPNFTDYPVNASGAAVTVTVSAMASAFPWRKFTIFKTDSSSNAVTISGVSGVTTLSSQYSKATIVSDGTTWWSI